MHCMRDKLVDIYVASVRGNLWHDVCAGPGREVSIYPIFEAER